MPTTTVRFVLEKSSNPVNTLENRGGGRPFSKEQKLFVPPRGVRSNFVPLKFGVSGQVKARLTLVESFYETCYCIVKKFFAKLGHILFHRLRKPENEFFGQSLFFGSLSDVEDVASSPFFRLFLPFFSLPFLPFPFSSAGHQFPSLVSKEKTSRKKYLLQRRTNKENIGEEAPLFSAVQRHIPRKV